MIIVNCPDGKTQLVNPAAIVRVVEAGTSSQWHGTRCFIKLFNGTTVDCADTLEQVTDKLTAAEQS